MQPSRSRGKRDCVLYTNDRCNLGLQGVDHRSERRNPIRGERFRNQFFLVASEVGRREVDALPRRHLCKAFAGIPTTVMPAGTSFDTTAPAPTEAPSPTVRYWRTCAPVPMRAAAPIKTPPEMFTVGLRTAPSPRTASCPMVQERFTRQNGRKSTLTVAIVPAQRITPRPILHEAASYRTLG